MLVRNVMSTTASVNVDTPLNEAIALMRLNHMDFLPVTHEMVCAGVLTENEINSRITVEHLDPTSATAGLLLSHREPQDHLTGSAVPAVSQETSVDEALLRMAELGVSYLAVHDDEYAMVGVVSRTDLEQTSMQTSVSAVS